MSAQFNLPIAVLQRLILMLLVYVFVREHVDVDTKIITGKAVENFTAENFSSEGATEYITAATFSSEGATEYITSVNFSPEGATEKFSSEGATANFSIEGAAEKFSPNAHTKVANEKNDVMIVNSVVEHDLNPQATCEVVGMASTETEPSLDESLVARVTSALAENGVKVTTTAAPLISPAVGIPTSLVQKELTPNIVPNFRSNNEEAVGLQVLNTSTVAKVSTTHQINTEYYSRISTKKQKISKYTSEVGEQASDIYLWSLTGWREVMQWEHSPYMGAPREYTPSHHPLHVLRYRSVLHGYAKTWQDRDTPETR
ncbi:hypothetical protein IFM89_027702 [Coptis chinensis]|uniref:Uncharacterized protein n=1 Tax=Coptis chinensis TaxID=261450 RepID=A0A835I098_9MAGN|nr:hypothetical protein IFM89_027702 [Coptis chinensis]